eukprot:1194909-Prorocentrum_minimum.AAC.11
MLDVGCYWPSDGPHLDVEDVVRKFLEGGEGVEEVRVHLPHRVGEHLALGAADLHLLQLAELDHRLRELQDVVAPLQVAVQPDEEGAVLEPPRVVGGLRRRSSLVVEVVQLERAQDLRRESKSRPS